MSVSGEAFNPHFVGYPNREEIEGITLEERTRDPIRLLHAIRDKGGVTAGFRFFRDHDKRVFDEVMADPRCAKIILTRNPVDSYVSLKIARATGQWKLTNEKRRKTQKITFDGEEFRNYIEDLQDFQVAVLNGLQQTGQTAFYLAYEDLQSLDVMNGLARHLGTDEQLEALDSSLKRQNPTALSRKVSNYRVIPNVIAELDRFNLSRTPNFEPRRGPRVPSYVAAARAPVLYLPVQGGPVEEVRQWLAGLDDVKDKSLLEGFTQKTLRQWMRNHGTFRSFTVIRHPVLRAHHAFCSKILPDEGDNLPNIRRALKKIYKVDLPKAGSKKVYDADAHRVAFKGFLKFLGENLSGQTSMRVDSSWVSQSAALKGFSELMTLDMVVREEEMPSLLPDLATRIGREGSPEPVASPADQPFVLDDIYDEEIEDKVFDIYQRDYLFFGFKSWK